MTQTELNRLSDLRDRRPGCDLIDPELFELYNLERQLSSNAYGRLVSVLSTFPPYLNERPYLISDFVSALYIASNEALRGVRSRTDFLEFLVSKSYVDNDLGLAFENHRAEFDRAIELLNI